MTLKLLRRSAGLFLLYDGVRPLLAPRNHKRKWETGILTLDDMFDYIEERPELAKKLAIVEISAGVWLTFG